MTGSMLPFRINGSNFVASCMGLVLTTVCVVFCIYKSKNKKSGNWKIPEGDLKAKNENKDSNNCFAKWEDNPVFVKYFRTTHVDLSKRVLKELSKLKALDHQHICKFYGGNIEPSVYIVTELCPRGSLDKLLEDGKYEVDQIFIDSLLSDLVYGMAYLHKSPIKSHGNLKSTNCVIDSRFILKITDFGLVDSFRTPKRLSIVKEDEYYKGKLWTAPELLRMVNPPVNGTQEADVYSFAIIAQEIYYRKGVYYVEDNDRWSEKDKLEQIINPKPNKKIFRPILKDTDEVVVETKRKNIFKLCWAENVDERPKFATLHKDLRLKKKNLIDDLMAKLENYSQHLEEKVQERTTQLEVEKERADNLLYQMLPPTVANRLKTRQEAACESYDCVTIYFSDIVGFTALSHASTPYQIVEMLNDLYTMFDKIIDKLDVYKVETIGDAYMVVSGLPERNGDNHAREIAKMSLLLRDSVKNNFIIKHMPEKKLRLRIGIHSGSVVTGVVGKKMPRYCLFGDTVNTASRMESNGEPFKIHVSPKTKELLDEREFYLSERTELVEMKGLGKLRTYWLDGMAGYEADDIISPRISVVSNHRSNRKISTQSITGISWDDIEIEEIRNSHLVIQDERVKKDSTASNKKRRKGSSMVVDSEQMKSLKVFQKDFRNSSSSLSTCSSDNETIQHYENKPKKKSTLSKFMPKMSRKSKKQPKDSGICMEYINPTHEEEE